MKDGGPAFPCQMSEIAKAQALVGGLPADGYSGMSLRDYFAAHAPRFYLRAMVGGVQDAGDKTTEVATIMATAAYLYADAMLAERANDPLTAAPR